MAKKCYNAAMLRHTVKVQQRTQESDGAGGYTDAWSDLFTASAAINPAKGYERLQAMQMETHITHKMVMRYDGRITTAHRILFGTRVFNIVEVLNVEERNMWLEITAVEGAAT